MDFFTQGMGLIWWAFQAGGIIVGVVSIVALLLFRRSGNTEGENGAIFGILAGVVLWAVGSGAAALMPAPPTFG